MGVKSTDAESTCLAWSPSSATYLPPDLGRVLTSL